MTGRLGVGSKGERPILARTTGWSKPPHANLGHDGTRYLQPRAEVKRSRGERAARIGRGRLDSLDLCIGFPSLGGEGPSSAFRLRATRLLGRTGRAYAPRAMSGASRATLPDYVSRFQSAAYLRSSSLAAVPSKSERRTLKENFFQNGRKCLSS